MSGETVRRAWYVCVFILVFGLMGSASQRGGDPPAKGEEFVGTWSGTWDAPGSGGGFELTLEKGKTGAIEGRVSVTGEPAYKATFSSLSFDGKNMTARYTFPPDEAAEIMLAASFDGKKATGTWSLRAKGNDTDLATGTWTVTRQ